MESLPTREEIERLAYQLWLERGRPEGTPLDDWERAERLLRFSHQDAPSSSTENAQLADSSPQKTRPIDAEVPPRLSDASPAKRRQAPLLHTNLKVAGKKPASSLSPSGLPEPGLSKSGKTSGTDTRSS